MFQVNYFILIFLGSLETFMEDYKNRKEPIPMNKLKSIVSQLLTGLKYVHEKSNYFS